MHRWIRLGLAAAFTLAMGTASGHGLLGHMDWCSAGTAVVVKQFSFSTAELREYRRCLRDGTCASETPCVTQTCGQFGDDWSVAARMAYSFCKESGGNMNTDLGTGAPVVEVPATFYDQGHHQNYHLSQGAAGVCVVCTQEPGDR
ncbi:hypothetical protein [Tahibacter amnicola]|uniref:Secreted protein n=1 Tax=Tahibacter amnicola TaxID=2976241 RepID=A0ABY6BD42_9GAMM|nr:hypothetical protein [Tahibacter amnicola]UXI67659.1 hypothetical protein N4264_23435 [Tahibacter amnicola]